jgi:uncharacterized protein (DUF1800 family)
MNIVLRHSKLLLYFASSILVAGLRAQTVTITPANPYIGVGATKQFTATVTGLSNTAVTWSLTGMGTNNPALGKISPTGLYTAPATPPAQNPLTVMATASNGTTIGTTYVLILGSGPTVTSVAPSPVNVGSYTLTVNGTGFVRGAGILCGGIALETTYVSATQLTGVGYLGSPQTIPLTVTNPGTVPSNSVNVTFVTPIGVSPATANVVLGASKTFTASVQSVTWSASAGAIISGGVFTAPTTMPPSNLVTITATGSGGQTGTARVTLIQPAGTVAPPTFSPAAGTYTTGQTVTLSTTTTGASIRYTTNGTTPSETVGTIYSAGFSVAATATVKAIAYKAGLTDSAVVTATYTITPLSTVAAPTFSPAPGTYTSAQTVTLTSATTGASIRYTTDGTTPSETAGTLYTAGFSLGSSATVKAIAFKSGSADSAVVSATYTINTPAVTISVNPTTASLSVGQPQNITPTVTGSSNLGVTWTLSGAGSLSAATSTSGTAITYTAPATITAKTMATVTATSAADSTKSAVTTITLNPPAAITVSPATVSVALNATQTFTASGQTSVTWSASAGSINASGVFTAPSTMTQTGTVIITATGAGNQTGTATVTLTQGTTLVSMAAASRFLQQAAFGPSPADVANVQNLGFQGWLNQQFAMPMVSNYQGAALAGSAQSGLPARFLANAVTNPDQLRQRVGFALSQIGVVSISTLNFNGDIIPYEEMLLNDAFTNYRQILGDITLSASMGTYLNMANNAAANPATGTVANENYAREIMQLFSLGTALLNQDGTRQTDSSGNPIATYNQTNVTELARVMTGWTYAPLSGKGVAFGASIDGSDATQPMVPVASFHDSGSKTLLPDFLNGNGTSPYVAPAGLTPQVDLSQALDNIFYHPNVGPFVGRELIKFLVKSNPSPAYVSRVAAAFANNGQGVRGDMQAVVTAVLLDPEARANDNGQNDQPTDGHLQEPALYIAGLYRALNGTMSDQAYFAFDLTQMGQEVFNPASVFNYYSPNYTLPQSTPPLQGGEFQIYNTFTSLYRANLVLSAFTSSYQNPVQGYGPGTQIDFTPFVTIATNQGVSAMVDALDRALTRGVMPAAMKQIIVTAVQAQSGAITQTESAAYLIATSNYYNVWH